MDGIARAAPEERAELFRRSAGALRPERSPAILEKDFRVCRALRRLYEVLRFRPRMIFSYPRSEAAESLPPAIQPAIRLEMGARSDDWPAEQREIRPFAADAFPGAFAVAASCRVLVMDARRTFWEKVTLLHAESHRPTDKAIPEGLSRHYYDVQQLLRHDIGPHALDRRDLLIRVVAHKQRFFSSAWANYGAAVTGGLRLVPPERRMASLRADYSRMREMIFGEVPSWAEIVRALERLEERINHESATAGS
jgi:hypothetical protein